MSQFLPGTTVSRSVVAREVQRQHGKDHAVVKPVIIDGTHSYDGANTGYEKYIRGGHTLAYNSTTGTWAPTKRTKAAAAGSASTALTVDNASNFIAGDSIRVGNNVAQAIVSINYSTNAITLTSAITWKDNEQVCTVNGFETARAILLDDEVSLWNDQHTGYVNKTVRALESGPVDQDKILGDITSILEDVDSAYHLRHVSFDDYQDGIDAVPVPFNLFGLKRARYVSADYTVTAADNGTLFVADAAVTFTLPAKAAGLQFGFMQTADANMVIASAGSADDIIADGDAGANTVTFSTASHKIGSAYAVVIAPNLLKWLGFNLGGTAATVA